MQYAPYFAEAGFSLQLWTFLRQHDLAGWYGPSPWRRLFVVLGALPRLAAGLWAIRSSDVVLVQREAVPFGPPLLEWFAARRVPLVWDVDDAVWQQHKALTAGSAPRWIRATGDKFGWLCRTATQVWAGSDLIAQWCRLRNLATFVVPTVVDVPEQPVTGSDSRVVGWIGSHSTGPFLEAVLPAITRIDDAPELVVVGATVAVPQGLRARQATWSPSSEQEALRAIRVGLYPIDRRHPMADGKCGLKAVLYMAHGVPCVVTPTPTNAAIVRDGIDGLYADTPQEWAAAVARLLNDDGLWQRCSRAAYERARSLYSTQVWGPVVAARACELVKVC